ncbi:hypothetical protein [Halorubellus sp. PRR65]|uniref:hypothetical protein n=1 Tax=Halorubellus sp. PRR65 TaxID=3098148 RepID=UPI002B2613E0|nr:hypothetical protein [Halorubellus sp. PRR65]
MPARRRVLAALAATTTTVVAGCQSLASRDTTRESTAREATAFTEGVVDPATSCGERTEPVDPYWTAAGPGPRDGFRLTASTDRVALGDEVTFTLTNVSGEDQTTGVSKKLDVQRATEADWHSIFGIAPDRGGIIDKVVSHEPGSGFEWPVTVSERGLTDAFEYDPTYRVCGPLEPGRYRFVYWGTNRGAGHAVGFEVVDGNGGG